MLLKAKHFIIYAVLCNVKSWKKLSFMIKNFEKWTEVMVLNFKFSLEKVLKQYVKLFF